jgi:hypothetical protein
LSEKTVQNLLQATIPIGVAQRKNIFCNLYLTYLLYVHLYNPSHDLIKHIGYKYIWLGKSIQLILKINHSYLTLITKYEDDDDEVNGPV